MSPERLRFDFSHHQAPSPDHLAAIEQAVQDAIQCALPVECTQTSYAAAQQRGAMALFGEKYGDTVRVVSIGDRSLELCGGTHARHTGELLTFKIVGSSSVSAGIRRLEAVTAQAALAHLQQSHDTLLSVAATLKLAPRELPERIDSMTRRIAELEAQLEAAQLASAFTAMGRGTHAATGTPLVLHALRLPAGAAKGLLKTGALKIAAEQPRTLHVFFEASSVPTSPAGSGLVVAVAGQEVPVPARQVLEQLMRELGGRGGGGPNFAQGVVTTADLPTRLQQWAAAPSSSPVSSPVSSVVGAHA